jgi:hypothetical protein
MISLRSSLEKLSAGTRVIFGVAALLENTPFELYTLIRSGSLIRLQATTRNASATMSRRTIWRSAEICRDHRVCRTRRWRDQSGFELSVPPLQPAEFRKSAQVLLRDDDGRLSRGRSVHGGTGSSNPILASGKSLRIPPFSDKLLTPFCIPDCLRFLYPIFVFGARRGEGGTLSG